MIRLIVVVMLVSATPAIADECERAIADPVATPIHDAGIDDQRAACLRTELGANVVTHALVDTPNFHGQLGGELLIKGRHVLRDRFEIGARARLFDYSFVQTAVNKVSEASFGPLLLSVAYSGKLASSARFALVLAFEAPFTRNEMDTTRTGAELTALVTGALAERWTVHGRLGAIGTSASSEGGTQQRLGLRGGLDLAWRTRHARVGLISGAELQAGYTALDTVLLREQVQVVVRGDYRLTAALGIRLMGNDATNAVFVLGLLREL